MSLETYRKRPTEVRGIVWTGANTTDVLAVLAEHANDRGVYASNEALLFYCAASNADVSILPGGAVMLEQDGSGCYPVRALDLAVGFDLIPDDEDDETALDALPGPVTP